MILLIIPFLFQNCAKEIHKVSSAEVKDGLYDSEFPGQPTSEELNKVMSAVKLLSTIAFYEGHEFALESRITRGQISDETIDERAVNKFHFNQPATGTATVIYNYAHRVALLTCAHIVSYPDTIVSYYRDDKERLTDFVRSVAFKVRQNINIIDFYLGSDFEILAEDKTNDIAIIGKNLTIDTPFLVPTFKYPLGRARELDWGNFVYLIGYPRGEKMITSGLVSKPGRDRDGTFLVDAVFNRGFSGGMVLALRDGVPNFELVGMAKSVPAESKLYLAPDKKFKLLENLTYDNYQGIQRVENYENIFYGITFVIPAETIGEFIKLNAPELIKRGYLADSFFTVK